MARGEISHQSDCSKTFSTCMSRKETPVSCVDVYSQTNHDFFHSEVILL